MTENTIVQYAQTHLESFDQLGFNEIDSLILSCMSYVRLPITSAQKVCFKDMFCAEHFDTMFHNVYSAPLSKELFTALCASPRYRNMKVFHYVQDMDETEAKQFSAVCFQLSDTLAYVAFRGTDATIVGWKEDFNMAFTYPVPSQQEAARYLCSVLPDLKGNVIVGGHSKGGNLAVYAAMHIDPAQAGRIQTVYSHDGPGFPQEIFLSEPFLKTAPKIRKTVPQSCVIGMILEYQENYDVIKSSRFSVWQHDPYSWLVEGTRFIHLSHLTTGAAYVSTTVRSWLEHISVQERERFLDTLYTILSADQSKTSAEFRKNLPRSLPKMIETASSLSPDTKHFLAHTLQEIAKLTLLSVPQTIHPKNTPGISLDKSDQEMLY